MCNRLFSELNVADFIGVALIWTIRNIFIESEWNVRKPVAKSFHSAPTQFKNRKLNDKIELILSENWHFFQCSNLSFNQTRCTGSVYWVSSKSQSMSDSKFAKVNKKFRLAHFHLFRHRPKIGYLTINTFLCQVS